MPCAQNGIARGIRFDRTGSGDPLLLIHGTGGGRAAWRPVVEMLADHLEVIALDLPNHGESGPPAPGVPPAPPGYAAALEALIEELGHGTVHGAGFSVGGWTALELAKRGLTRSVTAFAPAGLWAGHSPLSSRLSLWLTYRLAQIPRHAPFLLRPRLIRAAFLGQNLGRPWRVPTGVAVDLARTFATTRDFDEHLRATCERQFTDGRGIEVPVTVAFGTRERLLPRSARLDCELPEHTRWQELPGCGHIPTWDDPALVARTILETTRTAGAHGRARAQGRRRAPSGVPAVVIDR